MRRWIIVESWNFATGGHATVQATDVPQPDHAPSTTGVDPRVYYWIKGSEVDALRAEIERLRADNEQQVRKIHRLAAECVERLEDQERLRAALEPDRGAFDAWYDAKDSNLYVVNRDVAWSIWQAALAGPKRA